MEATIRSGPWRATRLGGEAGSRSAAVPTTARAAPGAQGARDRARRPQPTADLDTCARPWASAMIAAASCQLPRLPRPRAVEIHDVQPAAPGVRERARDGDRIVAVGGLLLEVPLAEPDDAPPRQVDRRQQLERWTPLLESY